MESNILSSGPYQLPLQISYVTLRNLNLSGTAISTLYGDTDSVNYLNEDLQEKSSTCLHQQTSLGRVSLSIFQSNGTHFGLGTCLYQVIQLPYEDGQSQLPLQHTILHITGHTQKQHSGLNVAEWYKQCEKIKLLLSNVFIFYGFFALLLENTASNYDQALKIIPDLPDSGSGFILFSWPLLPPTHTISLLHVFNFSQYIFLGELIFLPSSVFLKRKQTINQTPM